MLDGEEVVDLLETTESTMKSTTSTLMSGQLLMTLVLSVSLK